MFYYYLTISVTVKRSMHSGELKGAESGGRPPPPIDWMHLQMVKIMHKNASFLLKILQFFSYPFLTLPPIFPSSGSAAEYAYPNF